MRLIDLFAGCGGMTKGFVAEGYDPVLAIELDLHAAATYAANFGSHHVHQGDIADVALGELPTADVIIGGPPCQGFSSLGRRDTSDPRNRLWEQYLRVVAAVRPKAFVLENVDRFLRSAEFDRLRTAVAEGDLQGYTLSYGALNAADFGVPQRRNRAIVIGSRVGSVPLPSPTHGRLGVDGLLPWVTVREALRGIPLAARDHLLPPTVWRFKDTDVPGPYTWLDLHLGRRPREISRRRYDCIPPGGGRFDLPDELLPRCWRVKVTGTTDVMGRLQWDAPSLTIRTEFFKPEKGRYLHPQWDPVDANNRVNRSVTHLEAARLQTFPDDFTWCGSKISIARQIGNAVPVTLAQAVARHLKDHLVAPPAGVEVRSLAHTAA